MQRELKSNESQKPNILSVSLNFNTWESFRSIRMRQKKLNSLKSNVELYKKKKKTEESSKIYALVHWKHLQTAITQNQPWTRQHKYGAHLLNSPVADKGPLATLSNCALSRTFTTNTRNSSINLCKFVISRATTYCADHQNAHCT